mgnify:CR=1 FL=1
MDFPHVGKRLQPLPLAAAGMRAVIAGVGLVPQGAAPGRFPENLRIGTDEEDIAPALQPLPIGGVD